MYSNKNIILGQQLENLVHTAFNRLGYKVEGHNISDPDVDLKAYKNNVLVVAECLNWYGGFIHYKRFMNIVNNLCKYKAAKFLVCIGVKSTKEQYKLLNGYGIKVIHQAHLNSPDDYKTLLKRLGVITLARYNRYRAYYSNDQSLINSLSKYFLCCSEYDPGEGYRFTLYFITQNPHSLDVADLPSVLPHGEMKLHNSITILMAKPISFFAKNLGILTSCSL